MGEFHPSYRSCMLTTRTLGTQGLTVSALGLGCMGMSQSYGTPNDEESVATIHRALELGVTLFDTAEVYGPYTNETLLGRALAGRRDRAIIATKFGWEIGSTGRGGLDSRPAHIREAVEGSLRRLGTDHIDLLYQHRVDPEVPIEDVVGTMAELVAAGQGTVPGPSRGGRADHPAGPRVHPISALQSEYSLWERNLEARDPSAARELGIGLVPFSPLGRGFLTGTVKRADEYPEGDYRRGDPRFQGDNFDANVRAAPWWARLRPGAAPARAGGARLGAAPGRRIWCRFPAPSAGASSRRMSRRPTSGSLPPRWRGSTRRFRPRSSPVRATARA